MRGSKTIQTAGITCRFFNIGSGYFYSACCDKADSWSCASQGEARSNSSQGEADILIEEHFEVWTDQDKEILSDESLNGYHNRVYRDSEGFLYQTVETYKGEVLIVWRIHRDSKKITLILDQTETAGYFAFEHAGTILPWFFLEKDLCTMHGVLMEYKNSGIILTADSGVGKTTHARLWRDHKGALIINGDRISFRKESEGWMGYGLPWSGGSGEQINRKVPIHAVVQIIRGQENTAQRLHGMEAFSVILGQLLTPAWDPALASRAIDLASQLAEQVPVYRMRCNMEPQAADVLEEAISERLSR